jgi:hypothetical protein
MIDRLAKFAAGPDVFSWQILLKKSLDRIGWL